MEKKPNELLLQTEQITEIKAPEVDAKPILSWSTATAINFTELPAVQDKLSSLFMSNDSKKQSFITNLLVSIWQNDMLKKASWQSVRQASMIAAWLDLPLSPSIWLAYLVPYQKKRKTDDGKRENDWPLQAQLQVWYKWLIQLALRSGLMQTFETCSIRQNQIIKLDYLKWHIFDTSIKWIWNPVWFAWYLKLLTWYEKCVYMTLDEVNVHKIKYGKSHTSWARATEFEAMAKKTVAKKLLSYAPITTQIQDAIKYDQAVVNDGEPEYLDNPKNDDELNSARWQTV